MAKWHFFNFIFLTTFVIFVNGFELRGGRRILSSIAEDCLRPPTTKQGHDCCRLPKERIWGDLRESLSLCLKKIKQESHFLRQELANDAPEMVTPGDSDMITPTEMPSESTSAPTTSPYYTTPGHFNHRGRFHKKKSLSERFKELFSSVYKEIKNTFTAIWQSVVIITDQLHRHSNDSCFMECVFEDQGFLLDKMVNKAALLSRLSKTLGGNAPWHGVAVAAVETCYEAELSPSLNKTCHSGSEEIFRCIFRQIFFNCPNWAQMINCFRRDNYCISLREFYQKCPNGPPPEINDNHSTSRPPPEEDIETSPTTESNPPVESEITPMQ